MTLLKTSLPDLHDSSTDSAKVVEEGTEMSKRPSQGRLSASRADLELARRLSRRLRAIGDDSDAPAPGYASFDAAACLADLPTSSNEAFGSDGWHRLLDRCLRATQAASCFLIDAHGLIIAARGVMSADKAETLGGRLVLSLDHARAIDAGKPGASVSVVMQVGADWMTGLCYRFDAEAVVVGLVGNAPLSAHQRVAVDELVMTVVSHRALSKA